MCSIYHAYYKFNIYFFKLITLTFYLCYIFIHTFLAVLLK